MSIQFIKNECIIYFVDDGKGYADETSEGLGISNMRHRAADLNGQFEIKTDQEGTTVTIRFKVVSLEL